MQHINITKPYNTMWKHKSTWPPFTGAHLPNPSLPLFPHPELPPNPPATPLCTPPPPWVESAHSRANAVGEGAGFAPSPLPSTTWWCSQSLWTSSPNLAFLVDGPSPTLTHPPTSASSSAGPTSPSPSTSASPSSPPPVSHSTLLHPCTLYKRSTYHPPKSCTLSSYSHTSGTKGLGSSTYTSPYPCLFWHFVPPRLSQPTRH